MLHKTIMCRIDKSSEGSQSTHVQLYLVIEQYMLC